MKAQYNEQADSGFGESRCSGRDLGTLAAALVESPGLVMGRISMLAPSVKKKDL